MIPVKRSQYVKGLIKEYNDLGRRGSISIYVFLGIFVLFLGITVIFDTGEGAKDGIYYPLLAILSLFVVLVFLGIINGAR